VNVHVSNLRRLALLASMAVAATAAPLRAQQQGPVTPQLPAGAPDVPQTAPGTPARTPSPVRDGAPLLNLPSWMERMAAGAREASSERPALPPDLPEAATIPAGTRIPIVLETSLSSRFSHAGQAVVFRTTGPISLGDDLQVPPGVEIRGRVAEVTRPGAFGKSGALRVTVDRMILPGAAAARLLAQLRSADINARGRLTGESRGRMGREGLIMLSAQGALAGAQFGGKAAGIGAGAGAAVAAVMMMSKKGRDVAVSAGTPFSVRLQQDADLSASAVYWAQQEYASRHPNPDGIAGDEDAGLDEGSRPVLKRRPPPAATDPAPQH